VAVQVGDDGGQLAAAAVVRLIQRQAPRTRVELARLELVGERAGDLVAAGVLLARDLGVPGTIDDALGQPRAEAGAHPLTSG
jgi:hypothetical protein